jgi:hypothetical protein
MGDTRLPLEYMVTCSKSTLESLELGRLNQVSNLRKELRQVLEEWIDCEVDARLARWILECRHSQTAGPPFRTAEAVQTVRPAQLALSFLPSSRELAGTTENQRHSTRCDHPRLDDTVPTSARRDTPIDTRRVADGVVSTRGRRLPVTRPSAIPRSASGRTAESTLAPLANSAAIELCALDLAAHRHAPELLRTSPSPAKAESRMPFGERITQDLASLHSLQKRRRLQHGAQTRAFVPLPKRTRSTLAKASRFAPGRALCRTEMPPQSFRLRSQASVRLMGKTPACARQSPVRPGPPARAALRCAAGCA